MKNPQRLTKLISVTKSLHLPLPCLLLLAGLLLTGNGLVNAARGQQTQSQIYLSNVSNRPSGAGTAITITANESLSRAQTWQDREGFHVVVPDAVSSEQIKSGNGIRVRRIGGSVEFLVYTKPAARVSLQVSDNRLNLAVDSKLDIKPTDQEVSETQTAKETSPVETPTAPPSDVPTIATQSSSVESSTPAPSKAPSPAVPVPGSASTSGAKETVRDAGEVAKPAPASVTEVDSQDEGLLSSLFSGTALLIVVGLGAIAFLAFRMNRARSAKKEVQAFTESEVPEKEQPRQPEGTATSPVPISPSANEVSPARDRKPVVTANVPASLFGAYRIDQEVGKLVSGQPHRMDVMSSRATDDRRAIEASLLKVAGSAEASEDERRRARNALEEYGFVARQCANLLMAPEAFDRTSAARSLGDVGAAASLPFLLEALYDSEPTVRNQAVVSVGELKVPSAIGALLDMARTHPDVPSSLISRALNSCSVEGLNFMETLSSSTNFLSAGSAESSGLDISLEPALSVEDLPESASDDVFVQALQDIESGDTAVRSLAVTTLEQYRVTNSINALIKVARFDPEPNLRSVAVMSLASINHESVFSAVLIGMADDSREVRASAARSLSRLSFDRSDAYIRVIQTADQETLAAVADACIKSGIISQNVDRLTSTDRRQSYEAFTVFSLLVKAGLTQPVIEVIKGHANPNVRLTAVRLLATTSDPEVVEQLRNLSVDSTLPEEIKTAVLEELYKLEQTAPEVHEPIDDFIVRNSDFDLEPVPEGTKIETPEDFEFNGEIQHNDAV